MDTIQYWKIILEILILWYVIYMILLFVKGTRSEQLLKGLVIIGLLFLVTQQLGLQAINWALTRLVPISIIALVIVFQPELRRALAQLGQFGIHQENVEAIDEISRAAADLSRKKIGALIVLERESGLKSYIETGTTIDARVSSPLIVSLLAHQSPLHDGAIIVQSGRITAVGCVLPLPEEERGVIRHLGMRHRAAIGITHETDAVSVVVSEETGTISVASAGRLTQNLDEETLARSLKSMFYRPSKKRSRFRITRLKGG
jgi:diadenylate cyclase